MPTMLSYMIDATLRELTGTITAACHWNTGPNVDMSISLTRWECRGRTGYGDTQAASWTDFALITR